MSTAAEAPRPGAPMRARRHPGVVLGLWAWRTALSALVAAPVASLAQQVSSAPPRGDAALWDPGAHALLAALVREAHGLSALVTGAILVLLAGAGLGVVPAAAAMVTLAHTPLDRRSPRLARTVALAVARLPALAGLALGVTAAQAAIVAAAYFVARVATATTEGALGEAHAQIAGGILGVILATPAIALGIAHDLGRACVVRFRHGAVRAFFAGAGALRRAPLRLAWAFAWRGALGLVPVVGAATLAARLGAPGSIGLAGVAIAHQLAIAVRIAFRASWLAKALRSVRPG